jgi:hypothetical protein
MAIVYSHKRLDNNTIFYIGIGNTEKRAFSKHNRNKHWNNLIKKTDYKVEILFKDLSWKNACKKEVELISLYGRKDLNKGLLVNMTDGGDGVKGHSEESIKKIITAHKGKIHTKEQIQKRVDSRKGYIHSKETKLKMSDARIGIIFSDEHLKNLSLSHIGQTAWNGIITLDLFTGIYFDSLKKACDSLNLKYKNEYARMKRGNNNRLILI